MKIFIYLFVLGCSIAAPIHAAEEPVAAAQKPLVPIVRIWHTLEEKNKGLYEYLQGKLGVSPEHLDPFIQVLKAVQSEFSGTHARYLLEGLCRISPGKWDDLVDKAISPVVPHQAALPAAQKPLVPIHIIWDALGSENYTVQKQLQEGLFIQKGLFINPEEPNGLRLFKIVLHLINSPFTGKNARNLVNDLCAFSEASTRILIDKALEKQHNLSVLIQAAFRGHQAQVKFKKAKASAVTAQSWWRSQTQRQEFVQMRNAAILIESVVRGHQEKVKFKKTKASAVTVQSWWRSQTQRQEFVQMRNAAILIESVVRGHQEKVKFKKDKASAVTVQSWWRSQTQRQEFVQMRNAAILIESVVRRHQAQVKFKKTKASAVMMQALGRGYNARKAFGRVREAAILIESVVRGHQAQVKFKKEVKFKKDKASAVTVQSWWRSQTQRQEFVQMRNTAKLIQAAFRGHQVRQKIEKAKDSAVIVQSWWRGYTKRKAFVQRRESVRELLRSTEEDPQKHLAAPTLNPSTPVRRAQEIIFREQRKVELLTTAVESTKQKTRNQLFNKVFNKLKMRKAFIKWDKQELQKEVRTVFSTPEKAAAAERRAAARVDPATREMQSAFLERMDYAGRVDAVAAAGGRSVAADVVPVAAVVAHEAPAAPVEAEPAAAHAVPALSPEQKAAVDSLRKSLNKLPKGSLDGFPLVKDLVDKFTGADHEIWAALNEHTLMKRLFVDNGSMARINKDNLFDKIKTFNTLLAPRKK